MTNNPTNKPLAIVLGGTHDHITLIEKLRAAGFYVLLIDYNDNPPARAYADEYCKESTLDKEKVLEIAQQTKAALVIATCIDQALLTMSFVSEKLGLPCHLSYEQALNLTNKAYMKKVFIDNDIPTSGHVVLEEQHHINDILQKVKFPAVVKPSDSNSSKGIKKVENEAELAAAITEAFTFSRSKKVVVEDFVEGIELSVDVAVINNEAHIIMVTENIKNPDNKDNFTIIQNTFKKDILDKYAVPLKDIATKIARAFKIENGPLLIQVLANEDSLSVIEFSSRIGGGSKHFFINKISGFDILGYFINVILDKDAEIAVNYSYKYGSMNYLYAERGLIKEFCGFNTLLDQGVIDQFFYYKTEGMAITNKISSADRPAGYMVLDSSVQALNERIAKADATLKIVDSNGDNILLRGLHTALNNYKSVYEI